MMILGEVMNFGAYAFVEAIVVVRFLANRLPSSDDHFRTDALRFLISCCLCYHVELVPG